MSFIKLGGLLFPKFKSHCCHTYINCSLGGQFLHQTALFQLLTWFEANSPHAAKVCHTNNGHRTLLSANMLQALSPRSLVPALL